MSRHLSKALEYTDPETSQVL